MTFEIPLGLPLGFRLLFLQGEDCL